MNNNFVILQIEGKSRAHLYKIDDAAILLALDKLLFNMETAASFKTISKIDRVKIYKEEENDKTS